MPSLSPDDVDFLTQLAIQHAALELKLREALEARRRPARVRNRARNVRDQRYKEKGKQGEQPNVENRIKTERPRRDVSCRGRCLEALKKVEK
jgi:hypothetical protein